MVSVSQRCKSQSNCAVLRQRQKIMWYRPSIVDSLGRALGSNQWLVKTKHWSLRELSDSAFTSVDRNLRYISVHFPGLICNSSKILKTSPEYTLWHERTSDTQFINKGDISKKNCLFLHPSLNLWKQKLKILKSISKRIFDITSCPFYCDLWLWVK